MTIDNEIRNQGYIYFLAEAPELLQTLEQELFTLSEDFSIAKVHKLMRATHTLKGGAANIGLEEIKTIAHSLEDVFKSLYNPGIVIDDELQTLILQVDECLRLAITAELTGTTINGEELLQRANSVFAQLQEKLGDAFGANDHIPTADELGFDIVQSIFEVGVKQRLESIAQALNNSSDNGELINLLTSQAEVFIGLAESLNLPGFGAIAQTILAALAANPNQVKHIGEVALVNLQQAKAAVLSGDRISGGEPSEDLKALTFQLESSAKNCHNRLLNTEIKELYKFLTSNNNPHFQPLKPAKAKFYLRVIRYIFGWFNHEIQIPKEDLSLALLVDSHGENSVNYIENWLTKFLDYAQDPENNQNVCLYRQGIILTIILAIAKFQYSNHKNDSSLLIIKELQNRIVNLAKEYKKCPPITVEDKNWIDSPKLQKLLVFKDIVSDKSVENTDNLIEIIWGEKPSLNLDYEVVNTQITQENESNNSLNNIETLIISNQVSNQDIAEIPETVTTTITNSVTQINQPQADKALISPTQNQRKPSFVRVDIEELQRLNYLAGELLIYQKQRTLYDEQIREIIGQLTQQLNRHQTTLNKLGDLPLQNPHITLQNTQKFAAVKFDALEMDVYTEFHLTYHETIEETLQLEETTESLDILLTQATQIAEKTQNLTLNILDNLVEARMLPLGNILNCFSMMVTKLGNIYGKLVELKLSGTEVLVDKAIAEKLYEPLLHLVRNAFDHGIEPPQIRRQLGKSEQGLIEICAYHQGSQTIIEVRDDGQGLNFDKIRQKAIQLHLLPPEDESRSYSSHPTESELLDMIFAAGFSTADQVNEISGRGIGLEIVRSQLQALNGSISVKSSPQQGTTFLLKIPFSMTTDKLMLVQAGGVVYALLLDSIEKILIPSTQQIKEFEGKKVLHWHTNQFESMIVIRQLSELMNYNGSFTSAITLQNTATIPDTGIMNNSVLLLRRHQEIFGLEVDQIIGEQELVIRPLGNGITPPKYVYGCSSLANGTLILVIDAALLLESGEMQATLENYAHKQALLSSNLNLNSTPLLTANNKLPKVVLIVDDAISLRQTLSLTLQKFGYQVLQAQNGVEALEQLQLHPEIQVVISDLEMPRMNGFELVSHIRKTPNLSKLPIVILTSRSAEKHRQLAEALGADAYLTKPYLEDKFISTVESLITPFPV